MKKLGFAQAIEAALAQEMAKDDRIIIWGEDVELIRLNLFTRFGAKRVLNMPISEAAFTGAAVTAAMSGLKPVVEIMLADFSGVAMDSLINHAAKVEMFSGGRWQVPLVVRMACGGGYGDGGQHEQSLWGWFAHIPGLSVVVPSTPADAGGLMITAINHPGPVIYLEHKLLADYWLDFMGGNSRKTVDFDVPASGLRGTVPWPQQAVPLGRGIIRKQGDDVTIVSLGVSVHRCLEASETLAARGVGCEVIDLRSVQPLDKELLVRSVKKTNRLLVVDEDYLGFGLSGELAALVLEAGLTPRFLRVCTDDTIPFARDLEDKTLPNVKNIIRSVGSLVE